MQGDDLTRWRGSDRVCCRSWTTQVEIHYSLFAAVTILVFSLPFLVSFLSTHSHALSLATQSIYAFLSVPRARFPPRFVSIHSLAPRILYSPLCAARFFFLHLFYSPPPSRFVFRAFARRRNEQSQAVTSDATCTRRGQREKVREIRHARFG